MYIYVYIYIYIYMHTCIRTHRYSLLSLQNNQTQPQAVSEGGRLWQTICVERSSVGLRKSQQTFRKVRASKKYAAFPLIGAATQSAPCPCAGAPVPCPCAGAPVPYLVPYPPNYLGTGTPTAGGTSEMLGSRNFPRPPPSRTGPLPVTLAAATLLRAVMVLLLAHSTPRPRSSTGPGSKRNKRAPESDPSPHTTGWRKQRRPPQNSPFSLRAWPVDFPPLGND